MTFLAEKKKHIFKQLDSLYKEIFESKEDKKALSCEAWISRYNEMLHKCKDYALNGNNGEDIEFPYTINKFEPFKPIKINLSKHADLLMAIKIANELKYNIEELKDYFMPIEEVINPIQSVIHGINLKTFIEDKQLYESCNVNFEGKKYWSACRDAFVHLETRIRKKTNLSPGDIGINLVTKAFNVKNGVFKIPCCATIEEEEGFLLINLGLVKFHRNVKNHRDEEMRKEDALKIIGYVDHLLELIETSVPRQ